jgi:hypothetical protein
MLSPGLIKVAAHPDHGEPVDYQPGQLLPQWLSDLLERGDAALKPHAVDGVFELVMRPAPRGAKARQGVEKR